MSVGCKSVVMQPDGSHSKPIGQVVKHKLAFICPSGPMAESSGLGQRVLQARLNMAARLGRPVRQQEIADAMGVHSVTVGRWESGAKEPDLATIERLGKVLGVDPRWLAFGTEVVNVAPSSETASGEVAATNGVRPESPDSHSAPHVPPRRRLDDIPEPFVMPEVKPKKATSRTKPGRRHRA